MTTEVYPKFRKQEVLHHDLMQDNAVKFTIDLTAECKRLGITLDTVTWSTDSGNAAVSGEALASNVATGLITVPDEEHAQIKVKLEFSDSQILHQYIQLKIIDPAVHISPTTRSIWGTP